MASEVRSGTGNFTYTNSTGQNVRVVINYMRSNSTTGLSLSWSATTGGTVSAGGASVSAMGRNLAFYAAFSAQTVAAFPILSSGGSISLTSSANNMIPFDSATAELANSALPTEIMLAPGQTFSASNCGAYNIVIIPEAG
jgi:hypothetical protein